MVVYQLMTQSVSSREASDVAAHQTTNVRERKRTRHVNGCAIVSGRWRRVYAPTTNSSRRHAETYSKSGRDVTATGSDHCSILNLIKTHAGLSLFIEFSMISELMFALYRKCKVLERLHVKDTSDSQPAARALALRNLHK